MSDNDTYTVNINELILDDRLQHRQGSGPHGTDRETIERYAESMKDGHPFPPCEVIELTEAFEDYEVATLLVVGGFTRTMAARVAGLDSVLCTVRGGTWKDARLKSFKENSTHGKPRTPKEMNAILAQIEQDYPGKSVRDLAKLANCSHGTAQRFRKPPTVNEQPTTTPSPATPQPASDAPESQPYAEAPDDTFTEDVGEDTIDTPHIPDPHAGTKRGRRIALGIAEELKRKIKEIHDWKNTPTDGSALIKYGICEKAIEEAIRHLKHHCPALILTDEALGLLGGNDPTDGRGWLHDLGAERLQKSNQQAYAACIKL